MAHELWLVKGKTMTNITPMIGSLGWRSNTDELGDELSFDIAFNDARYFPSNPCELGDLVILKNGSEITRAIIVEEKKNGRNPIGYSAFDYAFYLNKSNAIYQFNKVRADKAIRKILSDFRIPIGNIVSMPTLINQIFNNKVVSDIIREIIELVESDTGQKLLMEMRQGKLYIEKRKDLIVKGTFNMAENITNINVTGAIMNPSKTRSIVDMKNSIQVVLDDKLITTVADQSLINRFGKLQEVVSIDEEEKAKATIIGKNKLKELAKISEDCSVELMGDDRFRAGRLFEIKEPITGLKETYLIKSADHSIAKKIHTMKLDLEAV